VLCANDRVKEDEMDGAGRRVGDKRNVSCIVVVLRADSPGKAAQWFAESIPES
jgi:hypothetical protein